MGPLDSELYRTPVSPPKYRDTQHNGEGGEREREREREGERERGRDESGRVFMCKQAPRAPSQMSVVWP